MTTVELSNEFDILYNNISSNQAPGLDEYEKSVFLTKAQEAVVTSLYNSFEKTEADRELLATLVVHKILTPITNNSYITTVNNLKKDPSLIFELDNELMFIVGEELIVNTDCGEKRVSVKPVLTDELPKIIKNPFNGVTDRQALRANLSLGVDKQFVELFTKEKAFDYLMSYIKRPEPIMLYTTSDFASLTINEVSPLATPRECKLNPMLHRTILETAVADAIARYK